MGHKVVYNAEYGGYNLSAKAIKMLREKGYNCKETWGSDDIPRHNKDLVEVVEALGRNANRGFARLKIVELPEGCNQYRITEYDGWEEVECPESIEWITIE